MSSQRSNSSNSSFGQRPEAAVPLDTSSRHGGVPQSTNGVCTKCKQPVPAANGACPVCVFAFGEPGIIREEMFQERVGLWAKRLWSAMCKTVKKLGKCAIDFPFHSAMTVLLVMIAMQMCGWTVSSMMDPCGYASWSFCVEDASSGTPSGFKSAVVEGMMELPPKESMRMMTPLTGSIGGQVTEDGRVILPKGYHKLTCVHWSRIG